MEEKKVEWSVYLLAVWKDEYLVDTMASSSVARLVACWVVRLVVLTDGRTVAILAAVLAVCSVEMKDS